jgi:hypothetical protein
MTFDEWVIAFDIGPSMNQRWQFDRRGKECPPGLRYNGVDGTVGKGWVPLLTRLATDLKNMGWTGAVEQIKEKFGSLRFYALPDGVPAHLHEAFRDRITAAEAESCRTCEMCGAPGAIESRRPNGGWIKCLCPTCRT